MGGTKDEKMPYSLVEELVLLSAGCKSGANHAL
jgi:hypothetical protein